VNTLYLKYAIEVERAGSISKAADRLYMNQPRLSKTIRELEDTLGIVIFKRTPKGITPTERGAEFLAHAKNILIQIEKMERLFSGDGVEKLSLNVVVPRASYISHAFTESVKTMASNKEVGIRYRETNSVQAVEDVVSGDSNLGIIRCPADYENYFLEIIKDKNLRHRLVCQFEYRVLMSREHKLANDEPIDSSKLGKYIEIIHGDDGVPPLSLAATKPYGYRGNGRREILIFERGSQFELLNKVTSTYMWASPMPDEVLKRFFLVQKKCDLPNNTHKDFLICRSGYQFSEEDKIFVEKLYDAVKDTAIT
jgi:DNA-binding transcriptional LysR family regulator